MMMEMQNVRGKKAAKANLHERNRETMQPISAKALTMRLDAMLCATDGRKTGCKNAMELNIN